MTVQTYGGEFMKRFINSAFFLFLLTAVLCTTVSPQVAATEATKLPMSIKAILPANQKIGVNGYFNLQVKPAEKQTIYIEIKNNKSEDITVNLMPTNAYTQPSGGIFYDVDVESPETSLLDDSFALSQNISMDSEVSIKANQTVEVPIEVTVPVMSKGTIIGGVLIGEKTDASEQTSETVEKDTAQFKVITKTAFAIAIQLDLPGQAESAFSFGEAGFNAVGPNVFIEMRNDAPMIQRQISGVYKVSDKDGQELFSGKFEPIIMAPKTKINFPMQWDSSLLESGKYTLSITADVAGEEIFVEENFDINNAAIIAYGERANQPIVKTQTGILFWVVIVATFITVGLVLWFVKKRK